MCGATYMYSSLESSSTVNYRRIITHTLELASLYTVPLSAVNGLSRLTKLTTSKGAGTADSIRKFSNRPITFESNRIGRPIRIRIGFEFESNHEASQVPNYNFCTPFQFY